MMRPHVTFVSQGKLAKRLYRC